MAYCLDHPAGLRNRIN